MFTISISTLQKRRIINYSANPKKGINFPYTRVILHKCSLMRISSCANECVSQTCGNS